MLHYGHPIISALGSEIGDIEDMAAGRSLKSLVGRRRRADEEGEDEDGPVMVVDSLSEGSVFSDLEDEEADASSLGEPVAGRDGRASAPVRTENSTAGGKSAAKQPRKSRRKNGKKLAGDQVAGVSHPHSDSFKAMADTEAMMNGFKIDDPTQKSVDFENMDKSGSTANVAPTQSGTNGHGDTGAERQRREHEEYRKRRDGDPAFIPNRGNFFMHDTRTHGGQGTPSIRGAWSGRGRGRGGSNIGGPFSPANQTVQAERAAEEPWKHDLHDTINEDPTSAAQANSTVANQNQTESARLFPKSMPPSQAPPQRVLSFSRTTLVGKVQIRVFFHGMKTPIIFSEVPWKQYTRLPDHRPPLRRDKPVRVSLPEHPQRYIFPTPERSFIFIPRQMRPNQQGFGRNAYQRSLGGYGYSSRRTSAYGGSMYAASVAASRRSSFASIARESAFSPVGSFAGGMPPTRPIVRLPHSQHHSFSASSTPMRSLSGHRTPTGMQVHTFPLPQQPTFQGIPTTTVHQPRPQKAISVTGIESPAILQQAPMQQEMQPFQNQLPAHLHEQTAFVQPPPPYFSPRQQYQYPQHPQTSTPLSGIPEQSIHAASFQPGTLPYGQNPYYAPYPQQGYYYPPVPYGYQPMPMYVSPPQNYMAPPSGPAMGPPSSSGPQTNSQPSDESQQQQPPQSQSGMVAHESNGMVYYIPASEAQQQPRGESYQPAESFVPSYAMPGLAPPTPAPEAAYYYPPNMQIPGMQQVGSAMYYPEQPPTHQQ